MSCVRACNIANVIVTVGYTTFILEANFSILLHYIMIQLLVQSVSHMHMDVYVQANAFMSRVLRFSALINPWYMHSECYLTWSLCVFVCTTFVATTRSKISN